MELASEDKTGQMRAELALQIYWATAYLRWGQRGAGSQPWRNTWSSMVFCHEETISYLLPQKNALSVSG